MASFNIIGDIAGRFNELMKLIDLMPKANKIILVGDLVDRGPDSRKVVEWAMATPDVITLRGNHEDMMIASYYGENNSYFGRNGEHATMKSYEVDFPSDYPLSHIKWMQKLPIYLMAEEDGQPDLYVSHAPWHRTWDLGNVHSEHWAVWHRDPPSNRKGVFQVYGHNHLSEVHKDENGNPYAMCVDNCGKRVLMGLSWPGRKVYEVPYED